MKYLVWLNIMLLKPNHTKWYRLLKLILKAKEKFWINIVVRFKTRPIAALFIHSCFVKRRVSLKIDANLSRISSRGTQLYYSTKIIL